MNNRNIQVTIALFLLAIFLVLTLHKKDEIITKSNGEEYIIYTGLINMNDFDQTLPPTTPKILILNKKGDVLEETEVPSTPICVQPRKNVSYSYALLDTSDPLRGSDIFFVDGDEKQKIKVKDNPHTGVHCPIELDSGNILLTSHKLHTLANGEKIQSFFIEEQTSAGEVVWTWDSLDHVATSSKMFTETRPYWVYYNINDYIHGNDISLSNDGNLLISGRHTNQIIKIDRETGEIIWRLGGMESDFIFVSDPLDGFTHQHSVTHLPNGNILLYDNGNQHDPQITRVVEYKIDEEKMTAELVWSFTDGRFTYATGNAQRLPNGNTLIGWGVEYPGQNEDGPDITEVTPNGNVVAEIHLPQDGMIYGAYATYRPF